jgi:hypothetical protein
MSSLLRTVVGSLEDFTLFGAVVLLFILIFNLAGVEVPLDWCCIAPSKTCRFRPAASQPQLIDLLLLFRAQILGGLMSFPDGYHSRGVSSPKSIFPSSRSVLALMIDLL